MVKKMMVKMIEGDKEGRKKQKGGEEENEPGRNLNGNIVALLLMMQTLHAPLHQTHQPISSFTFGTCIKTKRSFEVGFMEEVQSSLSLVVKVAVVESVPEP